MSEIILHAQHFDSRKNLTLQNDSLTAWLDAYFQLQVTTNVDSQKVQRRDIERFISFIIQETASDGVASWTPRNSGAFVAYMQKVFKEDGARMWNDKTLNRVIAHLKTFSKWIHQHKPFVLGDPMEKIKTISIGSYLEIERALTTQERRNLLDTADRLPFIGGKSKDRNRNQDGANRKTRKSYRPYRNRAIIYTLIETGMRRGAISKIQLVDVDFKRSRIGVQEKGQVFHYYHISKQGLSAIQDYLDNERLHDAQNQETALFLPASSAVNGKDTLSVRSINLIWEDVRNMANVDADKTPHSARHAMGKHIMEKTGNISAVQRQLGHRNAIYSMQYARISADELQNVLDERE